LHEEYAPRVHGYVRGKGVPQPDEVTNDVFAHALASLSRFAGDEPAFRSCLFTIAHRRVIDVYRQADRNALNVRDSHCRYPLQSVGCPLL
jgi:RNA polymerase sigma-70 factor (ECF subfamily)